MKEYPFMYFFQEEEYKKCSLILFGLRRFCFIDYFAYFNTSWILFQIVNIFNLFITYGDTFLPNPNSYDELYYEIIRMHQVFDNLYSMGMGTHFYYTKYTLT